MLKASLQHFKITCPLHAAPPPSLPETLTLLTAGAHVACAAAVANMPIPALSAVSAIGARVSGAPQMSLPGAETADTHGTLHLGQPPQVAALSIDEQVPHAAHEAEAEGGCPHLRGQNEGLPIFG